MRDSTAACWRCGAAIDTRQLVGRRDACLACGADLRCCRNCAHFAPAAPNRCREPQAERQADAERGNFCDWFRAGAPAAAAAAPSEARARLEALFARKPRA